MTGFVGMFINKPYQYGVDDAFVYVYWKAEQQLFLVGQTDAGYFNKMWIPYDGESQVYILISFNDNLDPNKLPESTEFDPDYYTWFHKYGSETVELFFYLDP